MAPTNEGEEKDEPNFGYREVEGVDTKYPKPAGESYDTQRRRLLWHSTKRGMVETELILGSFARQHLQHFDVEDLITFDALLQEADPDIFNWITGKTSPSPDLTSSFHRLPSLLLRLQDHAKFGRTAEKI